MGYHQDIDEYTEDELTKELKRRLGLRLAGACDYCGRPPTAPTCRFFSRHRDARIAIPPDALVGNTEMAKWAVVDTDNYGGDYPDEKFVGGTEVGISAKYAKAFAEAHNNEAGETAQRYWKVVPLPYTLDVTRFEP